MDNFDKKNINLNIQNNIDEFGCEIIEVEGNDYFPTYVYTIGLFQQFGHPEIVCFGLSSDTMTNIVQQVRDSIEESNISFEVDKQYYNFLPKEYPITFLKVNSLYYVEYLELAVDFYDKSDFPCYQLIWPDHSKLFPWQKHFDQEIKYNQPLLDRNLDFFFLEDRNMTIFTTENILSKNKSILFVEHDEEGDWFFLEDEDIDEEYIIMSTLQDIVKLDSTINLLNALDFNQYAIRNNITEDWIIE